MSKGFTLIELLAVIVILAVLALIAVPMVLSIINDSRESAIKRSAEFYASAVENKVMQENMKQSEMLNPDECLVNAEGNVICDGKYLEIEVNGQKPNGGSITFNQGKITYINLMFGDKEVSMNLKGELILGDVDISKPDDEETSVCTLISGEANVMGSKYECEVKPDTKYNFFVLSHEEDGTTNLIMERNICTNGAVATSSNSCTVGWGSVGNGPVNSMNYLYNATKDWVNISDVVLDYVDEGTSSTYVYGGIKTIDGLTQITKKDGTIVKVLTNKDGYTNLKARLPKKSEISGDGKCKMSSGSCPLWLSNYLRNSSYVTGEGVEYINGVDGYWVLSSSYMGATRVISSGELGTGNLLDGDPFDSGVRPVINVKL